MHDVFYAGTHTAVEQRLGARKLYALDMVAQAVLQHTDAIDDGIDVLQERLPPRSVVEPRKVGNDPLGVRHAALRRPDRSPGADHLVTGGM